MPDKYRGRTAERIAAKLADTRLASGLYKATSRPTPPGQMLMAVGRHSATHQVESSTGQWS